MLASIVETDTKMRKNTVGLIANCIFFSNVLVNNLGFHKWKIKHEKFFSNISFSAISPSIKFVRKYVI